MSPARPSLVEIPGGSFVMGGVAEDRFVSAVELPRHSVEVPRFAMAAFPVTRGEWFGTAVSDADLPITGVDFHEVQDYLQRLTSLHASPYRLPSEAEWEYACRAGSSTVFPGGNDLDPARANFLYDESGGEIGPGAPTPKGRYPANDFGLHDMLGNVCEWTADVWQAHFHGSPADGSAWLHGSPHRRVIRGGAWDHLPRVLRASWRDWAPVSARWDNLGFRICLSL